MDPDQQRLLIETPGTSSSSSAQNFGGQGKRRRRRSDDDERRTESCGWARTWNPDHQPCRSFPYSCCCPPSSADVRPLPCPSPSPSPCSSFHFLLLLLVLLLLPALGLASNASSRKADELIEVDWTLQQRHQRTTLTSSSSAPSLRRHASSASSPAQVVPTKFVRLKDVLRFRCPSQTPLAIHLVSAESALMCRLPDEKRERDRALIGYCGPHTSDPRLIIRQYSPLPGKPTFLPGQSYYFISTSDGTSDGVQSASGGLCRSNSLRLRIVVLPSASSSPASSASSTVVESSSRPADELTNLAELLYNANKANDGPDTPPSSVHHPPPLLSSSSSSSSPSSFSASTQQQEFDGFPAILTLEERDGQRRQVLVHSLGELAAQIDSANRRSGGAGLELSVHHQQQQQGPSADHNVDEMSRYELSGSSEEQNNPQQIRRHNNEAGGRHNKSPHQSNSNTQRPPKSVRSPEPLVEPQKLIYIIGYGEGQSSSSNGTADRAGLIRLILIILPILIPFLLLI